MQKSKIDAINSAIDNPSIFDKAFSRSYAYNSMGQYDNPFDVMGLGNRTQHRRTNHDVFSAALAGYQVAGTQGAMAGVIHTMLDKMSDDTVKTTNTKTRDLMEALINYYL